MSTHDQLTEQHQNHPDREIEEDVMNVPVIAWLGIVSSILITVSVILLIGVFYLTEGRQKEKQQQNADARVTDLEAYRQIDAMVVDGHFQEPDVEDAEGNVQRGKVNIPVSEGMRRIAEKY